MDLKPIFTTKPSTFDHEKVKKAIFSKINVVSLNLPGKSYGLHTRLIDSVKKIQDRHGFPIGIIHSIHPEADDLDIQMAAVSGAHAFSVSSLNPAHLKKIRYHAKKYSIPVFAHIDTTPKNEDELKKLVDGFILQSKYLKLFDFKPNEKKSLLVKHLLDFSIHSGASILVVGDWELAKILSSLNPRVKVAFVSKDQALVSRACFLKGVIPVFLRGTVLASLANADVLKKGQRIVNAVNLKSGVTIELSL